MAVWSVRRTCRTKVKKRVSELIRHKEIFTLLIKCRVQTGARTYHVRATQARSRRSAQLSRVYFCTMFTTPQTSHRTPDVWLSVGNTQLWY